MYKQLLPILTATTLVVSVPYPYFANRDELIIKSINFLKKGEFQFTKAPDHFGIKVDNDLCIVGFADTPDKVLGEFAHEEMREFMNNPSDPYEGMFEGFLNGYKSINQAYDGEGSARNHIIKQCGDATAILLTGRGRGGALATMYADAFAFLNDYSNINVKLVTFDAPRVFDSGHVEEMQGWYEQYRIVDDDKNEGLLVLPYMHMGTFVNKFEMQDVYKHTQ